MSNLKYSDLEKGDIFYITEFGSGEIYETLEHFNSVKILKSDVNSEGVFTISPSAEDKLNGGAQAPF